MGKRGGNLLIWALLIGLLVGCKDSAQVQNAPEPSQPVTTTAPKPVDVVSPTEPVTQPTVPEEPEPEEPVMLPEYQVLYNQNQDLVGWIEIPGTAIDYPVLQTPDRPNYYLHRNFEKEDAYAGAIYAREKCDVMLPSDNVTIYGHNMADGTMFGHLHKYKDKSFWEANRLIHFDTLYERHTYEIFAVFRVSANGGFQYHIFDTAVDQAAYDAFVSQCKTLEFFDTGITPEYGQKLITLSTCDRAIENGRLVVVARRIM